MLSPEEGIHTSTLRLKSQSLWYNIPIHAAQLLKIGTNYKVLSCSQEKYVLTVMFVHNPSFQTLRSLTLKRTVPEPCLGAGYVVQYDLINVPLKIITDN